MKRMAVRLVKAMGKALGVALRFTFFGTFAFSSWFSGKVLKPLGRYLMLGLLWVMVFAMAILFIWNVPWPLVKFFLGTGPFPWIVVLIVVELAAIEWLYRHAGIESPVQILRKHGLVKVFKRTWAGMTFSMDVSWEIQESLKSARHLWQIATGKIPFNTPSPC